MFLLGGGVGALLYAHADTSRAGEPAVAVAHDSAEVASTPTGAKPVAVSQPTAIVPATTATAAAEAASARIESGEADTDGALMKRAEARARAEIFRRSFPDGVLLPSIDGALGVVKLTP